jgi:hypothetical protein
MMLFVAILFGGVILFAGYQAIVPFLESRDRQLRFELLDRELEQIETLSARKGAILQTLKDIEFDYETGKISEDNYDRLRRRHERKALKVMRRLDELREGDDDLLDEIDGEVAERLEQLRDQQAADAPDTATNAEPRRTLECPACGRHLEQDARFCDKCGTEIDEETRQSATIDQAEPDGPPARTPSDVPASDADSDDLGIDIY